ncbi:hypothetical protein [Streptomyces sp. NBC_00091]|uniref:bestrophin-like domain n=1 Tax=Streptomyces sp. NBC_00091 TaxID=2975648 RepID=UPI0022532461|nr:hypothetical protein [Streptomyces sp. NBC_00091]MCX5379700.1 hypothetical protein [Streptomyces sp. NBC_00091]
MTTLIVVAAVALLASIAANRYLRPRVVSEDDEGMSVRDLIGPMQTLTVLLLAFVLATSAASYSKADDAARAEAHALDHLAEVASFVPEAPRVRLQSDVVCYARAVRHMEWPAMADGYSSARPSQWSVDMRKTFQDLRGDPSFGILLAADENRSAQRQQRLAQASPTIPPPIMWFLLCALAITVVSLGISIPHRNNLAQFAALTIITALLTSALVMIYTIDRPFAGFIHISPTAIAEIEKETFDELTAGRPGVRLPCDATGRRITPA